MSILKYSDLTKELLSELTVQMFVTDEVQSFSRTAGPKAIIGTNLKDELNRNIFYSIDAESDITTQELYYLGELKTLVLGKANFDIQKFIKIFGLERHLPVIKVLFEENL